MDAKRSKESVFAFKTEPGWSIVQAFYEQLQSGKRSAQGQTSLARIGWAIATLESTGANITAAAIGKLCSERWGGPKAQSIANDPAGYAKLVHLAKVAQSRTAPSKPVRNGVDDLLSRIPDPMVRAEVQLLAAETTALQAQITTLRAGMRRIEALGPITSEMATAKLETLEQLREHLGTIRTPNGSTFTKEERSAVAHFLASLESEGLSADELTGEIFGRNGRRIARPKFLNALKKVAEP